MQFVLAGLRNIELKARQLFTASKFVKFVEIQYGLYGPSRDWGHQQTNLYHNQSLIIYLNNNNNNNNKIYIFIY